MEENVNIPGQQATDIQEDGLNLRDWLDIVLRNWKWIALSAVLCAGLAYLYLCTVTPTYQRQAVMLVKDEKGKGMSSGTTGDLNAAMDLSGFGMGNSVENEVYILKSYQLMHEVVNRLNLNVSYSIRQGLRRVALFREAPFTLTLDREPMHGVTLNVEVGKSSVYLHDMKINGEAVAFNKMVPYGQEVKTPVGVMKLTANAKWPVEFDGQVVKVAIGNLENTTNAYRSRLETEQVAKQSTLVNITLKDENIDRADAILSMLLKAYSESIVEDKNRVATNTAKFVDERVRIISEELGDVEERLTKFKQANRLVDIQANSALYLQEGSKAKDETVQIEAQLGVAKYLRDYLTDVTKQRELIPNVVNTNDMSLNAQVQEYNRMMLQRNRLASNSSEENSVVQELNRDLAALRGSIEGTLNSNINALQLRLNKSRSVQSQTTGNIAAIPAQEKYSLDVQRQQAIKEALYTFLLNKREETNLQLAVTEANIRVVEAPFGSRAPIAPKSAMILLAAFLVGCILPLVYFRLREFLDTGVRGRKDIEDQTTLSVLGDIPSRHHTQEDSDIVVSETNNDRLTEAFRILRSNLEFANKDARVLMFTSTIAGEGKTFVSRNMAMTLAISGKKVVLVDTDIRKRTQSKLSGVRNESGVSTYLSSITENPDEIIRPGQIAGKVDVVPAGTVPPNPSELLMSDRLDKMIAELRKRYDYVILDNVPAQVVADAGIVNRVADLTLYVVRVGVMDRRYLPELERLHREKKFKNMYVILNDSSVKNHYGYGYGYGYGYSYGYGYGYYTDEDGNKKKYKKRIKHQSRKLYRKLFGQRRR